MAKKSGDLPRGIDVRREKNRAGRVVKMYRARVSYAGQQYSIGSFFTIGDAKAALSIARSEIALRTFIPPSQVTRQRKDQDALDAALAVTVNDWAVKWIEALTAAGKSPGTTTSYRSTLRVHVLDRIGDQRLLDVTRENIDTLMEQVRATGGPWNNVARTLRAMFRAAVAARVGGLTESPVHVTITKASAADESLDPAQIATPDEVNRLAAAMPEHLRIAVYLAAWCALRLGEVAGLQRQDFSRLDDPERAVVHVRRQWLTKSNPPGYAEPKRGSKRTISIPASLVPDLVNHLDQHAGKGPAGPLMPSPRTPDRPIGQTAFDRSWRTARDQVRPGFHFHSLRHTGLTSYAQQGATLAELQRRGGHRNVEAALKYQHATSERDRTLTDKLNVTIRRQGD